tara:strand:+ start:7043 stop:7774 length:732 start_codon:yes stop_codon:yes gene_type:complete
MKTISQYYKIKEKYNKQLSAVKEGLKNKDTLSINQKGIKFRQYVPKCINCKQPGGTIFQEDAISLIATCGAESPCDLNIIVNKKPYFNLIEYYHTLFNELNNIKNNIIITQLNCEYKYLSDDCAIDKAEVLEQNMQEVNKNLQIVKEKIFNITHNEKKQTTILKKGEELSNQINILKNSELSTKQMVNIQVNEIKHLAKEIRELKYKVNKINIIKKSSGTTRELIQHPYDITDLYTEKSQLNT